MRRIDLSRQAAKFLSHVPPKHGRQLATKIHQLASEPEPQDSKQLQGYPYLRADSGEYRIIYEFDEVQLQVLLVGKRNDDEVYRQLRRMG
jgi:mRNA interferase RelE/StbE